MFLVHQNFLLLSRKFSRTLQTISPQRPSLSRSAWLCSQRKQSRRLESDYLKVPVLAGLEHSRPESDDLKYGKVRRERPIMKLILACCKLYISESQNSAALETITRAVKPFPEAAIVNKFEDKAYNRVGYTLVSCISPNSSSLDGGPLRKASFAMAKAAIDSINLESHCGTHPRLGVVDHICFHPLAQASLDQVAGLAKLVAADIGHKLQVPTFLYGAAHEGGRTLDSIRREMGYFKPNSIGNQWAGGLQSELLPLQPDMGPTQVSHTTGVVVVGATRWVDNYNVPIATKDIAAVRTIAKRVSGRGGGLKTVQAMALAHGEDCIEVACNLLDPNRVAAEQVQLEIEHLATEMGMAVGKGYFTDLSQKVIVENYMKLGFV